MVTLSLAGFSPVGLCMGRAAAQSGFTRVVIGEILRAVNPLVTDTKGKTVFRGKLISAPYKVEIKLRIGMIRD